jgi:hypothetical protein
VHPLILLASWSYYRSTSLVIPCKIWDMKSNHAAALHIMNMARLEWQSFCFQA